MKIPRTPHSWTVTPKRAVAIQRELASRVVRHGGVGSLSLLAGVDMALSPDKEHCIGGVVVWDVQRGDVVEQHVVHQPLRFPYVPGLLSFREGPVLLAVLRKVRSEPDAILFDGQGLAHPRRFGIACHIGVIADRPSVGCAKSLLVGNHDELKETAGATARIEHHGECIGMAVRTRDRVKPMYVSIGHRVSLANAVQITLRGCNGYRMPEPTRLADQLVGRHRTDHT